MSEPYATSTSAGQAALVALVLLGLTAATLAFGQGEVDRAWELKACAPPNSLPFSSRDGTGYENRIGSLIADELGATLTYDWTPFTEDLINLHFAEGTCDLILGVPDGFEQGLNTVAYYQTPYVVVYRADAGFEIDSLDDPDLANLRIGIHGPASPPQAALLARGLLGNVTRVFGGTAGADDRLAVMVNALEEGSIDVGFGWGPSTAYWARRSATEMVVKPVEPQFEPPSIFQVQAMTMAVRRSDTALQRALNRAIAARWDDIQAVLAEYDVPVVKAPAPFAGEVTRPDAGTVVDIGVIVPAPTGGRTYFAAINDIIGTAAVGGAEQAESAAAGLSASSDTAVVLHFASSPSNEAAIRAARRLVALDHVDAIVGGVGMGQAATLAAEANELGVIFVNVGSSDPALRDASHELTYHVAPSADAYVRSLVRIVRERAGDDVDWFLVYLNDEAGRSLGGAAAATLTAMGEPIVGSIPVMRQDPTFTEAYAALSASGAKAVLVMLPAVEQLVFMGGYRDFGGEAILAPFPFQVTQTRNYLAASAEYGVAVDTPRLLAWDTSLADGGAGDFNRRYTSRFGQPADPTAWTTFEAVMLLQRAADLAGTDDPRALAEIFASGTRFKTAKGTLAFDEVHQLTGQTLYAVTINPAARWGPTLSEQVAAATLKRTLEGDDQSAP